MLTVTKATLLEVSFFFIITVDFTKLISQVQNAPILTSLSFNDLSL